MTDATKAAVAGADVRVKHGADRFTERQIGARDDAFARQHRPVASARGDRRDTIDELRLADHP